MVTCGSMEKPNIITIGWTGIVNTRPPMTYISVRPERYSYELIKNSGEFVINLTTTGMVKNADRCGTYSGRNVDKFADCEPLYSDNGLVFLPRYINSFMSLKVESYVDLDTHGMFICSISEAKVLSNIETMEDILAGY